MREQHRPLTFHLHSPSTREQRGCQDIKPPRERQSFSHAMVPFDLPHCPSESLILRRSPSTFSPTPFIPFYKQDFRSHLWLFS